jgi:16S rRNA (guanine966-N2)-methyltransferase
VVRGDVVRQLARLAADGRRFEIVFLDPPYATADGERALAALGAANLSAPEGLVVAQHLTKRRPVEHGVLRAFRDRRFGETTLTFFRAEG